MVPTITSDTDDPVMSGFERIARTANQVAEDCLARDLTESPMVQSLVDDEGGEHRRGWLKRLSNEFELDGYIIDEEAV